MKTLNIGTIIFGTVVLECCVLAGVPVSSQGGATTVWPGNFTVPLYFEQNWGQTDNAVKFLARGPDGLLFLTPHEVVFSGRNVSEGSSVRVRLVNATSLPEIHGEGRLPGVANYYHGQDVACWVTGVPTFSRVVYRDLYPGIDLHFYGQQGRAEYDFIVHPGADPQAIELQIEGQGNLELTDDGDLRLGAEASSVLLSRPVVYQESAGKRERIDGSYVLGDGGRVRFEVAGFDPTRPLVIDPVLIYSTYLGGSSKDTGLVMIDTNANAYVSGETKSVDFPVKNAFQTNYAGDTDVFITKVSPSGALVFSTYLGGDKLERGVGMLAYSSGTVYAVGKTSSTNFPVLNAYRPAYGGGSNDVFVAKISSTGSLQFSTYLGGSGEEDGDLEFDALGYIYVSGRTSSTNFPTLNAYRPAYGGGPHDLYLAKFNSSGGIQYCTYLGGGGDEDGSVFVEGSGVVDFVGWTTSTNFPTQNALRTAYAGGTNDLFVTKLNSGGNTVAFSTYLGGSAEEDLARGAIDTNGNIYVVGQTISTNFPTANAVQPAYGGASATNMLGRGDIFVTKFKPDGTLSYSTYLGGKGDEDGILYLESSGACVISGWTTSTNFPVTNAFQKTYGGDQGMAMYSFGDYFVTRLSTNGQFIFSTYLGGKGEEYGWTIPDRRGNYVAMGMTSSTNFPVTNAVQAVFGGGASTYGYLGDLFVTKFNPTGAVIFSTYLGGNADDQGVPQIDTNGNIYVTGPTTSTNYPVYNAAQSTPGGSSDVVVTKLNTNGQFVYSTYLGGSGMDQGYGYNLYGDALYVSGMTTSSNFPVTNAVQSFYGGAYDVFLTKLGPSGGIIYSTYLGGSGNEQGNLLPDGLGNVYVFGSTDSTNFPVVNALQSVYRGQTDMFLVKLSDGMPGCSYTISPKSISVSISATNGTVSVTTSNTCQWMTLSGVSWLAVTNGAGGSGSGTVSYTVAMNTGAARTGVIAIAGQSFTVNQAGAGAPLITITKSNSAVRLFWPASFSGCTLQERTNLVAGSWITSPLVPGDEGTNKVVTIPLPLGLKFYRLAQ